MRTIECRLEVNPDQMIPCIKAIRQASGCGLKEAKDFYDACKNSTLNGAGLQVVRMTMERYGELMLAHQLAPDWLFCFYDLSVVEEAPYIQL